MDSALEHGLATEQKEVKLECKGFWATAEAGQIEVEVRLDYSMAGHDSAHHKARRFSAPAL